MKRAHRLAVLTAAATCVLIVFGGLVTNTGAALAVPDWPTTFGHNMFLFPWSQMIGGVFYEHSHRLLGATVGLLTLALAAALWRRGGARVGHEPAEDDQHASRGRGQHGQPVRPSHPSRLRQ